MRFLVVLILPCLLLAESYTQILSLLEKSYSLQSAQQMELAADKLHQAAQGKNLPSLDLIGSATQLNETPSITFNRQTLPMGTRKHIEGAIVLSYPLFTGFAISSMIDKTKLEQESAQLKVLDLKRNLTMRATQIFSMIIAQEKVIVALIESQQAIVDSHKKAKGFFDNGLLPISELYAIEAKKYDIEAQITQHQGQKQQLLNQLSLLVNAPILGVTRSLGTFAQIPSYQEAQMLALSEREDLKAVAKALEIAQTDVTLAKSKLYPSIGIVGAVKHQGDTLALSGDGYSNADKSYVGLTVSWNIFNGYTDTHTIDAAQASKLSAYFTLENYKQQVEMELKNTFVEIQTIDAALVSAQKEVTASTEYAKLIQGRFDNQLTSADELSRSIASLAMSKAKVATLESDLFAQTALLWLRTGWNAFEEKLKSEKNLYM